LKADFAEVMAAARRKSPSPLNPLSALDRSVWGVGGGFAGPQTFSARQIESEKGTENRDAECGVKSHSEQLLGFERVEVRDY